MHTRRVCRWRTELAQTLLSPAHWWMKPNETEWRLDGACTANCSPWYSWFFDVTGLRRRIRSGTNTWANADKKDKPCGNVFEKNPARCKRMWLQPVSNQLFKLHPWWKLSTNSPQSCENCSLARHETFYATRSCERGQALKEPTTSLGGTRFTTHQCRSSLFQLWLLRLQTHVHETEGDQRGTPLPWTVQAAETIQLVRSSGAYETKTIWCLRIFFDIFLFEKQWENTGCQWNKSTRLRDWIRIDGSSSGIDQEMQFDAHKQGPIRCGRSRSLERESTNFQYAEIVQVTVHVRNNSDWMKNVNWNTRRVVERRGNFFHVDVTTSGQRVSCGP